jgi:DNA-binding MarR family transcriptional regulator
VQASSKLAPRPKAPEARTLAERFGELLRELLLSPGADHLEEIEARRLTLTQVRALLVLTEDDERPNTVSAIAERLGQSLATTSRALDALVRRRLASRREDTADRRCRRLTITASGRRLADRLVTLRNARLERFVSGLDADQRAALDAALVAIQGEERSLR